MSLENKIANWVDLTGKLTSYPDIYELQLNLARLRSKGSIGDIILFCQHEPVINFGRLPRFNSFTEDFLAKMRAQGFSEDQLTEKAIEHLKNEGIGFSVSKRGGGSAYIGPGQLVVYPIVDYTKISDPSTETWYQDIIDKVMQQTLLRFKIKSKIVEDTREDRDGRKDLWLDTTEGSFKLGGKSIGYFTSSEGSKKIPVAYHGFHLNVTDESIRGCKYVNLCGYKPDELKAMSMAQAMERDVNIKEVRDIVIEVMKNNFGYSSITRTELPEVVA